MRLSTSLVVVFSTLAASAAAFAPAPGQSSASSTFGRIRVGSTLYPARNTHKSLTMTWKGQEEESFKKHQDSAAAPTPPANNLARVATSSLGVWLATACNHAAVAAGPDWGIFEGRIGSLLHPVMMGSLLLYSLYTGFLGLQWRRQRTIGDDIAALKKTLPNDLGGASSVAEALAAAKQAEDPSPARVSQLEAALPIEQEIKDLQSERKELSSKGLRDQHFSQGALLAFLGTVFAIEGPLNTYARAGKLFPGPHLYAGAGLVVLWSLAAACVPAMSKGNDAARALHIGANVAGIGLFVWQVTSGIPILLKVIEKTSWP